MKSIGSFFRTGVIFCLTFLAGSAIAQNPLLGTNTPGTGHDFTFSIVPGVTNFQMVLSNAPTTFSHLLVRRGVPATDTNYEYSSTWDGTTNTIFLETPEVTVTNFHIR